MAFLNSEKAFAFSWCTDVDFASLPRYSNYSGDGTIRLCFMTTQVDRIYLVVDRQGFHYWPFVYKDGAWRKLYKHAWVVGVPQPDDLKTEQSIWEALCFQMVKQFRSSVESYYYEPPTEAEVLQQLGVGATTATLNELRYTWHTVYVQEDEEWDGAVEIVCAEGSLLIPYRGDPGNEGVLLTKYATYYPDNRVKNVAHKMGGWVDSISSAMRNMHWSNIRLFIESKGGRA